MDTPEVALAVQALAEREHPTMIVLEEAARAKEVVKAVKRATMLPITTEPVPARMDKVARVNAASPSFESGRILFPARYHANYGPWVEELITECKQFPYGQHDDMVDALVGGVLRLVGKPIGRPEQRKARIVV
jgi:predicted phage terminase large subunit-like protein